MSTAAVCVSGLVKRFGEVVAVDGVDLGVEQETVQGLLGPNGAGEDDGGASPGYPVSPGRRAR